MKLSKSFLKEKLFPDFQTSLRLSEDFSDMDACCCHKSVQRNVEITSEENLNEGQSCCMMHAMCAACVFVLTHDLLQQAEPTVMALQKLKPLRLTSLHLISQFVDQDVFSLLLISVQLQGAITFICLGRLIIISDSASSGSSKELAFLFRKKTTKGRGQKVETTEKSTAKENVQGNALGWDS